MSQPLKRPFHNNLEKCPVVNVANWRQRHPEDWLPRNKNYRLGTSLSQKMGVHITFQHIWTIDLSFSDFVDLTLSLDYFVRCLSEYTSSDFAEVKLFLKNTYEGKLFDCLHFFETNDHSCPKPPYDDCFTLCEFMIYMSIINDFLGKKSTSLAFCGKECGFPFAHAFHSSPERVLLSCNEPYEAFFNFVNYVELILQSRPEIRSRRDIRLVTSVPRPQNF